MGDDAPPFVEEIDPPYWLYSDRLNTAVVSGEVKNATGPQLLVSSLYGLVIYTTASTIEVVNTDSTYGPEGGDAPEVRTLYTFPLEQQPHSIYLSCDELTVACLLQDMATLLTYSLVDGAICSKSQLPGVKHFAFSKSVPDRAAVLTEDSLLVIDTNNFTTIAATEIDAKFVDWIPEDSKRLVAVNSSGSLTIFTWNGKTGFSGRNNFDAPTYTNPIETVALIAVSGSDFVLGIYDEIGPEVMPFFAYLAPQSSTLEWTSTFPTPCGNTVSTTTGYFAYYEEEGVLLFGSNAATDVTCAGLDLGDKVPNSRWKLLLMDPSDSQVMPGDDPMRGLAIDLSIAQDDQRSNIVPNLFALSEKELIIRNFRSVDDDTPLDLDGMKKVMVLPIERPSPSPALAGLASSQSSETSGLQDHTNAQPGSPSESSPRKEVPSSSPTPATPAKDDALIHPATPEVSTTPSTTLAATPSPKKATAAAFSGFAKPGATGTGWGSPVKMGTSSWATTTTSTGFNKNSTWASGGPTKSFGTATSTDPAAPKSNPNEQDEANKTTAAADAAKLGAPSGASTGGFGSKPSSFGASGFGSKPSWNPPAKASSPTTTATATTPTEADREEAKKTAASDAIKLGAPPGAAPSTGFGVKPTVSFGFQAPASAFGAKISSSTPATLSASFGPSESTDADKKAAASAAALLGPPPGASPPSTSPLPSISPFSSSVADKKAAASSAALLGPPSSSNSPSAASDADKAAAASAAALLGPPPVASSSPSTASKEAKATAANDAALLGAPPGSSPSPSTTSTTIAPEAKKTGFGSFGGFGGAAKGTTAGFGAKMSGTTWNLSPATSPAANAAAGTSDAKSTSATASTLSLASAKTPFGFGKLNTPGLTPSPNPTPVTASPAVPTLNAKSTASAMNSKSGFGFGGVTSSSGLGGFSKAAGVSSTGTTPSPSITGKEGQIRAPSKDIVDSEDMDEEDEEEDYGDEFDDKSVSSELSKESQNEDEREDGDEEDEEEEEDLDDDDDEEENDEDEELAMKTLTRQKASLSAPSGDVSPMDPELAKEAAKAQAKKDALLLGPPGVSQPSNSDEEMKKASKAMAELLGPPPGTVPSKTPEIKTPNDEQRDAAKATASKHAALLGPPPGVSTPEIKAPTPTTAKPTSSLGGFGAATAKPATGFSSTSGAFGFGAAKSISAATTPSSIAAPIAKPASSLSLDSLKIAASEAEESKLEKPADQKGLEVKKDPTPPTASSVITSPPSTTTGSASSLSKPTSTPPSHLNTSASSVSTSTDKMKGMTASPSSTGVASGNPSLFLMLLEKNVKQIVQSRETSQRMTDLMEKVQSGLGAPKSLSQKHIYDLSDQLDQKLAALNRWSSSLKSHQAQSQTLASTMDSFGFVLNQFSFIFQAQHFDSPELRSEELAKRDEMKAEVHRVVSSTRDLRSKFEEMKSAISRWRSSSNGTVSPLSSPITGPAASSWSSSHDSRVPAHLQPISSNPITPTKSNSFGQIPASRSRSNLNNTIHLHGKRIQDQSVALKKLKSMIKEASALAPQSNTVSTLLVEEDSKSLTSLESYAPEHWNSKAIQNIGKHAKWVQLDQPVWIHGGKADKAPGVTVVVQSLRPSVGSRSLTRASNENPIVTSIGSSGGGGGGHLRQSMMRSSQAPIQSSSSSGLKKSRSRSTSASSKSGRSTDGFSDFEEDEEEEASPRAISEDSRPPTPQHSFGIRQRSFTAASPSTSAIGPSSGLGLTKTPTGLSTTPGAASNTTPKTPTTITSSSSFSGRIPLYAPSSAQKEVDSDVKPPPAPLSPPHNPAKPTVTPPAMDLAAAGTAKTGTAAPATATAKIAVSAPKTGTAVPAAPGAAKAPTTATTATTPAPATNATAPTAKTTTAAPKQTTAAPATAASTSTQPATQVAAAGAAKTTPTGFAPKTGLTGFSKITTSAAPTTTAPTATGANPAIPKPVFAKPAVAAAPGPAPSGPGRSALNASATIRAGDVTPEVDESVAEEEEEELEQGREDEESPATPTGATLPATAAPAPAAKQAPAAVSPLAKQPAGFAPKSATAPPAGSGSAPTTSKFGFQAPAKLGAAAPTGTATTTTTATTATAPTAPATAKAPVQGFAPKATSATPPTAAPAPAKTMFATASNWGKPTTAAVPAAGATPGATGVPAATAASAAPTGFAKTTGGGFGFPKQGAATPTSQNAATPTASAAPTTQAAAAPATGGWAKPSGFGTGGGFGKSTASTPAVAAASPQSGFGKATGFGAAGGGMTTPASAAPSGFQQQSAAAGGSSWANRATTAQPAATTASAPSGNSAISSFGKGFASAGAGGGGWASSGFGHSFSGGGAAAPAPTTGAGFGQRSQLGAGAGAGFAAAAKTSAMPAGFGSGFASKAAGGGFSGNAQPSAGFGAGMGSGQPQGMGNFGSARR